MGNNGQVSENNPVALRALRKILYWFAGLYAISVVLAMILG